MVPAAQGDPVGAPVADGAAVLLEELEHPAEHPVGAVAHAAPEALPVDRPAVVAAPAEAVERQDVGHPEVLLVAVRPAVVLGEGERLAAVVGHPVEVDAHPVEVAPPVAVGLAARVAPAPVVLAQVRPLVVPVARWMLPVAVAQGAALVPGAALR